MSSKLISLYNSILFNHPILTKSISTAFLFGLGDIISQKLVEKTEKFSFRRTAEFCLVGFISGPLYHYWYHFVTLQGEVGLLSKFSPKFRIAG